VLKELAYKAVVGYGGCYKPALEDDDDDDGEEEESGEEEGDTVKSEEEDDNDDDDDDQEDGERGESGYRRSLGNSSTQGSEHPAADLWADLRKMGESYLECPFEEELRKMLPPAVISQRDVNSLRFKGNNRVKLRLGIQTAGANCN